MVTLRGNGHTVIAALFDDGPIPGTDITMDIWTRAASGFTMLEVDQVGTDRPANTLGDIGSIEIP